MYNNVYRKLHSKAITVRRRAINQVRKAVLTITLGVTISSTGIFLLNEGWQPLYKSASRFKYGCSFSKLSVLMWLSLLGPKEIIVIPRSASLRSAIIYFKGYFLLTYSCHASNSRKNTCMIQSNFSCDINNADRGSAVLDTGTRFPGVRAIHR